MLRLKFFSDTSRSFGSDANNKISSGDSNEALLNKAAREGNLRQIQTLIDKKVDVNCKDPNFNEATPLHHSSFNCHFKVMKILLDNGAGVDMVDSEGCTPLHHTAFQGNKKCMGLLLEAGAKVDHLDIDHSTPLHKAAFNGHHSCVELLVERGANLELQDIEGISAIQKAAYNGHVKVIKLLLDKGANVNGVDAMLSTALHKAAYNGKPDCVRLLLERGASVDAQDSEGNTPLHSASYSGNKECVKLLLEYNAILDGRNKLLSAPVHFAAFNGHTDVLYLLIAKKADLNLQDKKGMTPLHHAVKMEHKDCVMVLLERGADPNIRDAKDRQPQQMLTDVSEKGASDKTARAILRLLQKTADKSLRGRSKLLAELRAKMKKEPNSETSPPQDEDTSPSPSPSSFSIPVGTPNLSSPDTVSPRKKLFERQRSGKKAPLAHDKGNNDKRKDTEKGKENDLEQDEKEKEKEKEKEEKGEARTDSTVKGKKGGSRIGGMINTQLSDTNSARASSLKEMSQYVEADETIRLVTIDKPSLAESKSQSTGGIPRLKDLDDGSEPTLVSPKSKHREKTKDKERNVDEQRNQDGEEKRFSKRKMNSRRRSTNEGEAHNSISWIAKDTPPTPPSQIKVFATRSETITMHDMNKVSPRLAPPPSDASVPETKVSPIMSRRSKPDTSVDDNGLQRTSSAFAIPPFRPQLSSISDSTGHFQVVQTVDDEPPNETSGLANSSSSIEIASEMPPAVKSSFEIYGKLDRYGFIRQHSEPQLAIEVKKREAARALKWTRMIRNWPTFVKKNKKKVQERVLKGVPDSVRIEAWKLLCGSVELRRAGNIDYSALLLKDSDDSEQIERDIHRTFPRHIFFSEIGKGQTALFNVLKAYSVYNKAIGYCQGMGFISALLLMYMPEEDAFFVLARVIEKYEMGGLFAPGFPRLGSCMYILEKLLHTYMPKIHKHLLTEGVSVNMFAPQWFITVFLYNMPFPVGLRIWDAFLYFGFRAVYQVAMALFKIYEDKLLAMEFEEILSFLSFAHNEEQTTSLDPDQLMVVATSFKIKDAKLQQMESEYNAKFGTPAAVSSPPDSSEADTTGSVAPNSSTSGSSTAPLRSETNASPQEVAEA